MRVETVGDGTLYLADCYDLLGKLPAVDAVVTDPPYGIGFAAQPTKWQRRAGKAAESWDDRPACRVDEIVALGKRQAVWGGNYYNLPPSRGWLSWFKPDAPPSMASFELAWTNVDQNSRQITYSIGATNAERVGHPTQKPLAVMEWTLHQIGASGVVLDPFMGSGTTGVACANLGHHFVGYRNRAALLRTCPDKNQGGLRPTEVVCMTETTLAHELRITRCKSCRARIIWLETKNGKMIPVEADTVKPEDTLFVYLRHHSHFVNCPHRNSWRR